MAEGLPNPPPCSHVRMFATRLTGISHPTSGHFSHCFQEPIFLILMSFAFLFHAEALRTPARASLDLLRPCCARLLALLVGQPDRCATGESRDSLSLGGYPRALPRFPTTTTSSDSSLRFRYCEVSRVPLLNFPNTRSSYVPPRFDYPSRFDSLLLAS